MAEQLFARLEALRQRVRQLLWIHGACWLAATFLGALLICGMLDWLLRLEDVGLRCVLSLTVVGLSGFVGWRVLVVPLLTQLTDLDLALRIERRYPDLRDSLASAVQFLQSGQTDLVGSIDMQRATISQAIDRLRRVSPESMLELKPVKRAGVWAGTTATVFVLLVSLNTSTAALAFQRLALPFKKLPWPRQYELRFVTEKLDALKGDENNSMVVALGETVSLYVENTRGPLPKNLTFEARVEGHEPKSESMRQTALWDAKGKQREIGTVSLAIVRGPIRIRAFGGDGETESFELDVVEPPRVQALFVKVIPPAYSGLPERQLSENVGHVEALVGSKVKIEARSTKRLKSASLQIKDGESLDLVGSEDARGVSGEFTITKAGSSTWWLTLQDEIGFDNVDAQRYDLRGIADLAPEVRIEKPVSDQFVTPTAKIPFTVSIRDDMAIKAARLTLAVPYRSEAAKPAAGSINNKNEGDEGLETLTKKPLPEPREAARDGGDAEAQRAAALASLPTRTTIIELPFEDARPKQLQRDHELDLAVFTLEPGMRIVVHGEATDYYDLGSEHVGRSLPRTLTILSPEAKRNELQDRQQALVLELERIQKQQTTARSQVKELQLQVDNAGQLRPADLDMLKRVELDQKQINTRLTSETEGVEKQARTIQAERAANQVNDPKSEQLLQTLAETIEALSDQALPQLQRELGQTLRANADAPKPGDEKARAAETKKSLDQVARRQDEVLKQVGSVLDQFQEWKRERNLTGDLRELSTAQQKLTEDSKQLGQQTVTKSFDGLTPQQKAELSKLAERQQQLANQVEKFSENLQQKNGGDSKKQNADGSQTPDKNSEQLPASDEQRALDDVQRQLDDNKVAAKMRQAAGSLGRNQISDAVKQQEQLAETLRKLQDTLEERDVTDQESLVKKLAESVAELDQLRQQQDDLMRKVDAAQKINDAAQREETLARLKKEQEQLQQRTEDALKRLEKLGSQASRQSAQRAAGHMQKAAEQLQQGNSEQAEEEQKEALDDLEQAEREAAKDKQQAELELAQEVIERIADQLKSLRDRQQAAVDEGLRLQAEFNAAGKWTRGLLKSARTLGQSQKNLADETRSLATTVKVVEALTIAVEGAARLMDQAAALLEKTTPQADEFTISKLKRSKQRFDDLLAALDQKSDDKAKANGQPQPGEGQKPSGPQGDAITIIAQLQVIRTLQTDLIERVGELEDLRVKSGQLNEAQSKELEAIADEQSRLADLVRELTEYFGDAPLPMDESQSKEKSEDAMPDAVKPTKDNALAPRKVGWDSIPTRSGTSRPKSADIAVNPEVFDQTPPRLSGWFRRFCTTSKSAAVSLAPMPGNVWLFASPLALQDEPSTPSEKATEKPAAPAKPGTKPKSVDDELLDKFAPGLPSEKKPDAEPGDPLEKTPDELNRTIESMREVSKKLSSKDLSDETRKRQQSILSDIDKLIEKLKQPPPPSDQQQQQNSDPQQQDQQNQQQKQNQKQKQQSQNQQQPSRSQQTQGTGAGNTQQQKDSKAGESTDKELQRKLSDRTAELARRRALIDEVWGHLPPALREQLLNANSEKMLPLYEDLIRAYYESLARAAEEKRKKK